MEEDKLIKERKDKLIRTLKEKNWIIYFFLSVIVGITIYIRTRNLYGLKDISTGGWTLGPDLDPFLFLRWGKYIAEHGSLYAVDVMRYVPLGFETNKELLLLPYMMAWFHKVATIFGSSSFEQSAVIFPVFMFAITIIAFFFMCFEMFKNFVGGKQAYFIAIVATLFLAIMPPILPRTIAGIPEKESVGFFFLFLSFYLFLKAWKSEKTIKKMFFGIASGITTGMMGLSWGGVIYIFLTIGIALYFTFFIGESTKDKFILSISWFVSAAIIMNIFSERYSLIDFLKSTTILIPISALTLIFVNNLIQINYFERIIKTTKLKKFPYQIISLFLVVIIGLIFSMVFFGSEFIFDKFKDMIKPLINPVSGDRHAITVAENRQPYFVEWANNFGPNLKNIPIFFLLTFIGTIFLYYKVCSFLTKKDKLISTSIFTIFLISVIFSRYKPDSLFNGTNIISIGFYALGIILLIGFWIYYYKKAYISIRLDELKKIDFGIILLFSFFLLSIISARGAVRLIMVLVPTSSIMVSYLVISSIDYSRKMLLDNNKKTSFFILTIILIIASSFSAYSFYEDSVNSAKSFIPNSYTQQWQLAMNWVRTNTSEQSVFSHWWDYGYWVQSIGERASVLDGGNSIGYWNHFMGRHVLTGQNEKEALNFMYVHNTTHLLIDPTDIGKYTAFSSIGSDESYDRRSWINTFIIDKNQIIERKNTTSFIYVGQFILDENIIYENGGIKVFLPGVENKDIDSVKNIAGVVGVKVDISNNGTILQPSGIFVYQGKQYLLPLRYVYYNGKLYDFGSGIESGIFLFPMLIQRNDGGYQIENFGALLYLSRRTINSNLARFYLFGVDSEYIKLEHVEDSHIIKAIKNNNNINIGNFIYYGGLHGPIKIWKISYPKDILYEPKFLEKELPENIKKA